MLNDVLRLPAYPSTASRKNISPSQLAELYQTIASTLGSVLALPTDKRDTPSTHDFLSTFAKDTAFHTLQNLIWKEENTQQSANEKAIRKQCLLLAEKLASSPPGLDLQLLLDLSIIYARIYPTRLQPVFAAAFKSNPPLSQSIANDLAPGFTIVLEQQQRSNSQGLYAQRKVAECILTFLRGAKHTPELVHPFAHNKQFILALASLYDTGMTAIAVSYGGIPALNAGIAAQDREADDWERIWVETKVTLLDAFHIILSTLLDDLAASPAGPTLAMEADRTFDTVFALLEVPSTSSSTPPTPFLNQSLLADYQQAYSLSKTLAAALKHAQEKDVRLDLLESTLQSLDSNAGEGAGGSKNAGALKILLRSSGIQPGLDNRGARGSKPQPTTTFAPVADSKGKGKSHARTGGASLAAVFSDPDLEIKATQVLDILPDTPVDYVKLLLAHDRYGRNPEKVVEALLEGTVMSQEELERDLGGEDGVGVGGGDGGAGADGKDEIEYSVEQRRNVFDEEHIDVSRLRVGKKAAGDEILRDRSFIEQMKADILRRAEALSDEEEEQYEPFTEISGPSKGKGKEKQAMGNGDLGLDDDEEDAVKVRLAGDGEDSGEEEEEEEEEDRQDVQTLETLIELAYIRDPKVFERDAGTRRSKARADLKAQTGWADEQIEGWKVMLERTPGRKEQLMEKHAFTGNQKGLEVPSGGGSERGRGRGRPRGRGGPTRGGRGGGGGGDGGSARERAWKDKNKASRGNHNRKRGHDKKMARAGAGPST